jgi:hypothetical protein
MTLCSGDASFQEGSVEQSVMSGMDDDEASGFFFNFLILEGFSNEVTFQRVCLSPIVGSNGNGRQRADVVARPPERGF